MRRYDIVSGILLILSVIDFALAAPVLVQENCHADIVHIPKDETTVLGKRTNGIDELEKFLKSLEMPDESSDSHVPSIPALVGTDHAPPSSAPPEPDHGYTSVVQGPAGPNRAPSTTYPSLLMEPLSPSSGQGEWEADWFSDDELRTKTSSEYGSDHELTEAHTPIAPEPNLDQGPPTDPNVYGHFGSNYKGPTPGQASETPQLVKTPETGSSALADPDFDWEHWQKKVNEEDLPPVQPHDNPETGLPVDSDFDWEHWQKKVNEENAPPAPRPPTDPYFDMDDWMSLNDPLALAQRPAANWAKNLKLASPDSDHYVLAEHQPPIYPQSPADHYYLNPPSSPTEEYSYSYPGSMVPGAGLPTVPEHEVATSPLPGIESPTDAQHEVAVGPPSPDLEPLKEPENEVQYEPPTSPEGDPSSITNSQPVDPQALTQGLNYVLKGKAKVSDATRNPWNADQSEFEPA